MKLNTLYDDSLKRKHKKCVGRGGGCGKGKTCGRGHKGQKARTGKAIKGFEGGQMPIERRLPKRGFNSTKRDYTIVSLGRIQEAIDKKKLDPMQVINKDVLKSAGLLKKVSSIGVKVLSDGEITSKINLKVEAISLAAKEKLVNNGSTVHVV